MIINNRGKFGYSLMELLVVISIITILMGVSFPMLSDYGRQRSLDNGTEILRQAILKAKNSARAPSQEDEFEVDDGYQVLFRVEQPPPQEIRICKVAFGTYKNFLDSDDNGACNDEAINLPRGIHVNAVGWRDLSGNFRAVDDAGYSGIQFEMDGNGMKFFSGSGANDNGHLDGLDKSDKQQFVIRVGNVEDGKTKDIVIQVVTGAMYVD